MNSETIEQISKRLESFYKIKEIMINNSEQIHSYEWLYLDQKIKELEKEIKNNIS